jgi:hypothetical protein
MIKRLLVPLLPLMAPMANAQPILAPNPFRFVVPFVAWRSD